MMNLGEEQQRATLMRNSGIAIEEKDVAEHLSSGKTVLKVTYPWAPAAHAKYFAFPDRIDADIVGFELVRGYKALPDVTALSGSTSRRVVVSPVNGAPNVS